MKKKITYLSFLFLSFFIICIKVNAASISMSRSSSTVSKGSTVKITVKVSGATSYTYSNFTISYDQDLFTLSSGSDSCNGLTCLVESNGSVTLTFKAIAEGSAAFSASGTYEDDSSGNLSASTKVTVGSSSSSSTYSTLSSDNSLSSLSVNGYDLSPSFSSDITEYTLSLSSEVTSIDVVAKANDSTAGIKGSGSIEVSEGINTIEIVVTAANGNTKTYTIKVTVDEKNPIEVSIGNQSYTLVKNADYLSKPDNYEEVTITIDGYEIPAFYSEITGFTLVGLKDEDGNISLYIYDEDNQTYTYYQEVTFNSIKFYPMNTTNIPKGYQEFTIIMNDIEIQGFKIDKDSLFAIVYGMDLDTGKKNYYMYDIENNTLQLYNDEHVNLLYDKQQLYSYIILASWVVIILFIVIVIVLCCKNSRRKKKIKNILNKISGGQQTAEEKEIVNTDDVIEEIAEQEEMYDIREDEKKKSKKKNKGKTS